ncbi:MAG: 50S ribosomal protein L30 [Acidobacteria bacterium]|nr:50S ribosomal protein L30 [Acidobacteriota bacterium]
MTQPEDTAAGPGQPRIVVQLVRGLAGTTRYQREVVKGLGLRRLGATASRPDNPMIRGMVRRVPHLVRIVEETASSKSSTADSE